MDFYKWINLNFFPLHYTYYSRPDLRGEVKENDAKLRFYENLISVTLFPVWQEKYLQLLNGKITPKWGETSIWQHLKVFWRENFILACPIMNKTGKIEFETMQNWLFDAGWRTWHFDAAGEGQEFWKRGQNAHGWNQYQITNRMTPSCDMPQENYRKKMCLQYIH